MRKLLIILFFGTGLIGLGQDIHFSQFYETPLLINPASAGFYEGYERLNINHKSQWTSIGAPYRTTSASFDLPFFFSYGNNAYLGAGISYYNDKAGDSQFGTNQVNLSVSGILPVDDKITFAAGLQFGVGQRSGKIESLTFGNQFSGDGFDPDLPSNEVNTLNSFMYPDVGAGINFEFDNRNEKFDGFDQITLNAGAAIFHVNKPLLQYTSAPNDIIPMKFIGHLKLRYDIPNSTVSVVPHGLFAVQGPHQEIYGGMSLRFQLRNGTKYTGLIQENALYVGIQTRVKDALTPLFMIELTDYAIGLSYDISLSKIGSINAAAGGFEITFRYINLRDALWKRKTKGSFRSIK